MICTQFMTYLEFFTVFIRQGRILPFKQTKNLSVVFGRIKLPKKDLDIKRFFSYCTKSTQN